MGTACGKVILCGEHAVVHGGDALVVGIDRGAVATGAFAPEWRLTLGGRSVEHNDSSLEALRRVAGILGCGPVDIDVQVTMPLGVGLGGSAAMGVAAARAIGELRRAPLSDSVAFAAAQGWEGVFHGNPSGVDAAAAVFGGCLLYNRRQFVEAIEAHSTPVRLTVGKALHLALAVAGPPSLTKAMVERVTRCKVADPEAFDAALEEIQTIVEGATDCVESGDVDQLGPLLSRNHALLSRWGLSTPSIDHACALADANGARGSKLTGAGGGGCVVALCTEDGIASVLNAWTRAGFRTLTTTVAPSLPG